jgi:membrane protein implicated in regulation of membrane protease activity
MKLIPVIALVGSGAAVTAVTTGVGLTSTIELQLLIFINVSVLMAVLLRKHLHFPPWLRQEKKAPEDVEAAISNTSWFVTNRLGLKKASPEEPPEKYSRQKTHSGEIGKIVPVVEPIDPHKGSGKVKYKGMNWPARSADSQTIAPGEKVLIVGRDLLTLKVEKIKR